MKVAMIILAVCSLLAGFVPIAKWVTSDGLPLHANVDFGFSTIPVLLAVVGITFAAYLYKSDSDRSVKIVSSLGGLYKLAYHKFYIDELYLFVTKKIIFNFIGRPAAWVDKYIVDGLMNEIAAATEKISYLVKGMQSGKLQNYALYFFFGILGLAIMFIYLTHN
jgi:NADH-quinone oxidoreductase subunit L